MVLRGFKKIFGINSNGEPTGPFDSLTPEEVEELKDKELKEKQASEELNEMRTNNIKGNQKGYTK